MSGMRGTCGRDEKYVIILARNLKRREQLGDLNIDKGMILKWIINFVNYILQATLVITLKLSQKRHQITVLHLL
jgi:hypothetical protein